MTIITYTQPQCHSLTLLHSSIHINVFRNEEMGVHLLVGLSLRLQELYGVQCLCDLWHLLLQCILPVQGSSLHQIVLISLLLQLFDNGGHVGQVIVLAQLLLGIRFDIVLQYIRFGGC